MPFEDFKANNHIDLDIPKGYTMQLKSKVTEPKPSKLGTYLPSTSEGNKKEVRISERFPDLELEESPPKKPSHGRSKNYLPPTASVNVRKESNNDDEIHQNISLMDDLGTV